MQAYRNRARSNRKGVLRLLVGGGILAFILGNVFAAAININNGVTGNFGQGVNGLTACADGITYSVVSDFGTSGFQMASIEVKVVDGTLLDASGSPSGTSGVTFGACDNKTMTVYAYNVTSGTTSAIATMSLVLNATTDNAGGTETYYLYAAPTTQEYLESPQFDSTIVTPVSLGGLAFEISD
jgi:hypothetical protein